MTKCSKKVSMKWTSLLAQGWTKIPGAQQISHCTEIYQIIHSRFAMRGIKKEVPLIAFARVFNSTVTLKLSDQEIPHRFSRLYYILSYTEYNYIGEWDKYLLAQAASTAATYLLSAGLFISKWSALSREIKLFGCFASS